MRKLILLVVLAFTLSFVYASEPDRLALQPQTHLTVIQKSNLTVNQKSDSTCKVDTKSLQISAKIMKDTIAVLKKKNATLMEFKSKVMGDLDLADYLFGFFFAGIGLFFTWVYKTRKSIKTNPETPVKFSWSYWFKDNLIPKLLSVISTMLVIFVSLRVAYYVGGQIFIGGTVMSVIYSIGIGLSLDTIIDKIMSIRPVKTCTPVTTPTEKPLA